MPTPLRPRHTTRKRRLARRSAAIAVGLLAGLAGVVAPAHADEVGPYVPPPFVPRTGACTPFGIGTFETDPRAPELVHPMGPVLHPTVHGRATVDVRDNVSCSFAQVQVVLQSNVCGFWGCHWRDYATSGWTVLPESGEVDLSADTDCREDSNTYRVLVQEKHAELDFEQTPRGSWVPFLDTKNREFPGDVIRFDC